MAMKLVVGLGNPGQKYERTRHNIGFEVVEELARRQRAPWKKPLMGNVRCATVRIAQASLLLAEPLTFMNRSGEAVRGLSRKRRLNPQDILVIYDDADLVCGRLRIRLQGGAGGHNGLQSIISALGTDQFPRLRMGVGPRPGGHELIDFVLSAFAEEERAVVDETVQRAVEAIECAVRRGMAIAMNEFNGK